MSANESSRMLGRYELLKRIAKGGMGEIYLARTRGTGGFEKNCIIKTILPHLAEEEEFVTKFLDEGRIVVQLVHGNIVPVFDMGDEDGEFYMAMEYIPGRDLREVTKRLHIRGETMPVDLALFVASEVCKGLDYAHRKCDESGKSLELVHRDVSPSNVLISREGEVKLIDFGIARASNRMGKTVSGRIQGKFCYMSPEQAAGGKVDGRSDIFSTGLVLYELLTGFRPFEGDSDLESLELVRRCEFDPPSSLTLEISEEVDAIVAKALAKDPADRYATMDKLHVALMQYLFTIGTSPTSYDLAVFLSEMFPEGLEREELRSARDSGPPRAMSLDEALDFELGRMDGAEEASGVDPHETTAVSSDFVKSQTKTRSTPPANSEESQPTVPEPMRRKVKTARVGLVLILVAVLGIGGAFAAFAFTSTKGKRTINSDPPGAQIIVDGLLIPGATTPHTLSLNEGEHEVTLELEGYESLALFVDVEAGTTVEVAPARMRAKKTTGKPQLFELRAEPTSADVTFVHKGATLTAPVITLNDGEVALVTAMADGCAPASKEISYGAANRVYLFTLDCKIAETTPDKPPTKKPVQRPPKADTPPPTREHGCIIMSIENPFYGEWSLDGQTLGSRRGFKRELPAGRHTVRVINTKAGIDHREQVTVEPGKKCTNLHLDGEALK